MGTSAFRSLLVWNGKAELLAASIVFVAWVKSYQVGRCRLDMCVKDGDVHQLIEIVSDYLVIPKIVIFLSDSIGIAQVKNDC